MVIFYSRLNFYSSHGNALFMCNIILVFFHILHAVSLFYQAYIIRITLLTIKKKSKEIAKKNKEYYKKQKKTREIPYYSTILNYNY